jgi:hypothetical protein
MIEASETRRARRTAVIFERDRERTVSALMKASGPVNAKYLRDELGINGVRMNRVLASLLNDKAICGSPQMRGNRTDMCYWLHPRLRNFLSSDAPNPGETDNMNAI